MGYEEELYEDFDEELLPSPPSREDTAASDEEGEVDAPSPYLAPFSHILPFLSEGSWFPHRHLRPRGPGLIPEGLWEAIAFRMDSMIPEEPVAPPEPDLHRAKILVDGLERVSGGLLERMLRVGGAPGAYEDVSKENKSVSGCAICWENLLDENVPDTDPVNDELPFAPENEENGIVCLPCAHVFHCSCLIPWFSQKTSCPTCRFNIDSDFLTRRLPAQHQEDNQQPTTSTHSAPVQSEFRYEYDIYAVEDTIEDGMLGVDDSLSETDDDEPFYGLWAEPDQNHFDPGASTQSIHGNKSWTRPDAPGKSLRESIEEKEREMGLRCLDPICIFGPTDEVPNAASTSILPQISIKVTTLNTCIHMYTLVRSARAAGWKVVRSNTVDVYDRDFSTAEVLCPSCFSVGTVSRKDWEEGVLALTDET